MSWNLEVVIFEHVVGEDVAMKARAGISFPADLFNVAFCAYELG